MSFTFQTVLSFLFILSSFRLLAQSDTEYFVDGLPLYKINDGWHFAGPDAPGYRYCESGLCQGDLSFYYENGVVKHKATYKDGQIYGKYYDFYENGQLEHSGEIYGYKQVDTSWSYYRSGILKSMCVHRTGGGYGSPFIKYFENGQIEEHEFLNDSGYFNFRFIMAENGDTTYAEYLIDHKNLIFYNYSRYENGQIEEEGKTRYSLKSGYQHIGTWMFYNEKGELTSTKEYPPFEDVSSDD